MTLNGGVQISAKAEPLDAVCAGEFQVDRHFYLNAFRKAADGLFVPIIEQRGGDIKTETEHMLWRELMEGKLTQEASKRAERLALTPIAKAFFSASKDGHKKPRLLLETHSGTKLTANRAEQEQMRQQVLKQQVDEKDKKTLSRKQSPLLLAFAKQAAVVSKPSKGQ